MSESEIEQEINRFVDSMDALGITLSEDEIDAKRRELEAKATGDMALLLAGGEGPDVETWEEVAQLPPESIGVIDDFIKLDDKSQLVNRPFFIRKFWFTEGDMGGFAVAYCVTRDPILTPSGNTSKIIITDGSTGIYRQLREVAKRTGKTTALLVRNGLRVSEYTADTEEGPKLAETFYLT
jgi:hypothetical protein